MPKAWVLQAEGAVCPKTGLDMVVVAVVGVSVCVCHLEGME